MTTAILAANPVTLGSTVIQSSMVLLASGEFVAIPWKRAHKEIDRIGRPQYFPEFPGAKNEDSNVMILQRKDGTQADKRTWVVITAFYKRSLVPSKTTDELDTVVGWTRAVEKVQAYHFVDATSAAGTKSTVTSPITIQVTRLRDPWNGGSALAVTDETHMLQEALNFVITPVAAAVPTFAPFEAAISGQVPV